MLGVNWGNLGFLAEVAADEMYEALETLLVEDEVRMEHRIMLSTAYINGATGEKSPHRACPQRGGDPQKEYRVRFACAVGRTRNMLPPIGPMD